MLGGYFFNPSNAGKDVYLYITREDIIQLAKPYFVEKTDEEIWRNFLFQIKYGLPGSGNGGTIINRAINAHKLWVINNALNRDGVRAEFPPYIIYLIFLVLPLNNIEDEYNANNYYKRLESFLRANNLENNFLRSKGLSEIEELWIDLENWANSTRSGEIGYFRSWNFKTHWRYVGKLFSQCIFPPKAIKKLPELFLMAEMIPNSAYKSEEIKEKLLKYGPSILHLHNNVLKIIGKSDNDDLGKSIIETVRKEYFKWTGESHTASEGGKLREKRNYIYSRIYLQFQIFNNSWKIEYSYRLKSLNEFPEDLNLHGEIITEQRNGFSKTIKIPFKESFQLNDDFNKWIAKFPDKDVRLFISAGTLQLSTDYWIETDNLSKTNWMYLLCRENKKDKILSWLKNYCKYQDESSLGNMPNGFCLFKFLEPKQGLEEIPELTLHKEKNIEVVEGLKYDFRTFIDDFLPEVEIINADGNENVFLHYKDREEKIFLEKNVDTNRWLLPEDIARGLEFNIKVEGEIFAGNETSYKIVSSNKHTFYLKEEELPKRDSFGRIMSTNENKYALGSNIVNGDLLRYRAYNNLFIGITEDLNVNINQPKYKNEKGNILLSFLTLKGKLTAYEFNEAFEYLHSKYFLDKQFNSEFNYTKIKKVALNYYNNLGYLDYDYETKSIVMKPTQLIFLPTNKGRQVMLIGKRNTSLVSLLIATATKYNLQVQIIQQSNEHLLLPDTIVIESFGLSKENYGEGNLRALANELNIKLNYEEWVQIALENFSSNIIDYEKTLYKDREATETYEDWARYTFNSQTLQLDKSYSEEFDKSLSLVEYRLRPWEFYYRLWKDQKCYEVDRDWGKYIILKYKNKQVIYKGNDKVAIPIELPLPRLLEETIILCSGIIPKKVSINSLGYKVYENIPGYFIHNLFSKLGQIPIQNNSL